MKIEVRFLCLLVVVVQLPAEAEAQGKLVDSLTKSLQRGVWVSEKTCFHSWHKDSCESFPVDSGDFFWFEKASSNEGFGGSFSLMIQRRQAGFIYDPITGKKRILHYSCPDYYCFLGTHPWPFKVLFTGEHWPYYAELEMLSDNSFSVKILEGDWLKTDYYRRIPVPGFLKSRD